jgi:uncharacterized protein DUF3592
LTTTSQRWGIGNLLEGCGSCLSSLGIFAIFLAIGAGLTIWGWSILQSARASSTWPTVAGTVVSSEVTHSTDADGDDSYQPRVVYQYVVRNVSYENNTIKFGENSYSSQRQAEQIASGYPAGKEVIVHHHPEQPDQSVLEPGVSGGSYIVLGIGVLFVVIALITAPLTFFLRNRGSD